MRIRGAVALACLVASACADLDPVGTLDRPGAARSADDGAAPPAPPPPLALQGTALETAWRDPRRGAPYPIVLVHGFSGWNDAGPLEYFFDVRDDLEESRGERVVTPALPPYNTPDERALVLADVIDAVLEDSGKDKVHLIAHSQGGLDARYAISTLGYGDRVASLTTISTPHRGTPLADAARAAPDGGLNAAGQLLGWLIGALEGEPPDEAAWSEDDAAGAWEPALEHVVDALSQAGSAAFNAANQDAPGVVYMSVAGVSNLYPPSWIDVCADAPWGASSLPDPVDAFLVSSGMLITSSDGVFELRPNDGIVPLDSAVYGTFLGCFPADHFDEIGQIADVLPEASGFSHLEMYRKLVDNVRALEQAAAP